MEKNTIWVLLRTHETDSVYAELNDSTIRKIAEEMFEWLEDEYDDDAPKTASDVESMIREDILNDGMDEVDYEMYTLKRFPFNTIEGADITLDDPGFEIKEGAKVYEVANEMCEGCGMDVTMLPIGFFSKQLDHPELEGLKWIEHTIQ